MTISSNIPKNILKQIIDIFPNRLSFAFAYGSGVFNQTFATNVVNSKKVDKSSKTMIDLILVVNDSNDFHYNNLIRNRNHYSFLGYLGSKWLTTIQESFGAKIYFNTLIPIEDYFIKYGIISTKHLINDCNDWQSLYVSGRLHKPVHVIQESNCTKLTKALQTNTNSALHTALLLLSETFTEQQLYSKITELSYMGDFRMSFGEDKRKILNIVGPQIHNFRHIYQPLITSDTMSQIISWNPHSRAYTQDCSPNAILHHLNCLPKTVEQLLINEWNRDEEFTDIDELLQNLSESIECKTLVRVCIQKIVQNSSLSQTFKGIFTAGLLKSLHYSTRKIYKMFQSFK